MVMALSHWQHRSLTANASVCYRTNAQWCPHAVVVMRLDYSEVVDADGTTRELHGQWLHVRCTVSGHREPPPKFETHECLWFVELDPLNGTDLNKPYEK